MTGDQYRYRVYDSVHKYYCEAERFTLDDSGRLCEHFDNYIDETSCKNYPKGLIVEFCTTMKDIEGVLVFDRDIIAWTREKYSLKGVVQFDIYGDNEDYVVFEHLGWNCRGVTLPDIFNVHQGKVIGNIHDNPELLETA